MDHQHSAWLIFTAEQNTLDQINEANTHAHLLGWLKHWRTTDLFTLKQMLVSSFACSILVSCMKAQEPATRSATKLPALSEAALEERITTLKAAYAFEYRRTEDKNEVQARFNNLVLARKLIKSSEETPPDSEGYYPMLSEAARLATAAYKVDVAFDAIRRLQRTHDIDTSGMRLKVLAQFDQKSTRISDVRAASPFVIPAIQAAADAQELKTASKMLDIGEAMAKRTFDRTLQKDLAAASELLELLEKQEDEVVVALDKIAQTPEDADANLTVAKFIGLRQGDWEKAEGYAARVDEDDVRSLFVREFAAPKDVEEILQLANDWWEFAETQTGAVKLQAAELAATRYMSIEKRLKGFEQKQVETRLKGVVRDHVLAVRMPVAINAEGQAEVQPPAWLNKGLVAHYPFNGNARDESGNGNDGEIRGSDVFGRDRNGMQASAYSNNGSNRYITVPNSSEIVNPIRFTIGVWVKLNNPLRANSIAGASRGPGNNPKWMLAIRPTVPGVTQGQAALTFHSSP